MTTHTRGMKKTTKAYRTRPSPPYSARDFKVGTTKKGNDGNRYVVSSPSKIGIKRWVKKSAKKTTRKPSSSAIVSMSSTHKRPKRMTVHEHTSRELARYGLEQRSVTFTPYMNKPPGNKWMFYSVEDREFRLPEDYGTFKDTSRQFWDNAQETVDEGTKVWYVESIPKEWTEQ